MTNTKKILITVFSLIIVGAFVFTITWGVINFNKVKEGMSGTGIYTEKDINNAYDDGYNNGVKDKAEYVVLIEEYRNTIAKSNDTISQLNFQVAALTNNNKDYTAQVNSLTEQKIGLETQVVNLETIKAENEKSIQNLNSQIAVLQSQANQVPDLNAQISSLQALVAQLQTTNQLNNETINNLNTQIVNLNNQIREMSNLSSNASAQIAILNNRINELQASINYYESFISTQENSAQAVATYEVDGAVWKIEIVNKGEIALPQFTNTDTLIFNGWTVNDTLLGNTYTINANTKFVASVVHKYAVQFMVDDVVYDNQYVVENENAIVPATPTKTGYDFLGWSLNGVDVVNDINAVAVTENVTYHAVFVKVHTVTFMNGDQVVATQNVRNGEYANANNVTVETDGTFMGWQINDSTVEVNNYQILADIVFVAQINYEDWLVVTRNINYIASSETFDYNGDIYAVHKKSFFKFDKSNNEFIRLEMSGIPDNSRDLIKNGFWTDGENLYYSQKDELVNRQYLIDFVNNEWVSVSFGGYYPASGYNVWSDGDSTYYSYYDKGSLVYDNWIWNKQEKKWYPMNWNGDIGNRFYGSGIREKNGVFYHLGMYGESDRMLNETTKTWDEVTVNREDFEVVYVVNGEYFNNSLTKKYNKETMMWEAVSWTGIDDYRGTIWTDGENIYYSRAYYDNGYCYEQYKLRYKVSSVMKFYELVA